MERLCTLKHSNFVDVDASDAKSGTKYRDLCLEVIQGHTFWDRWKADEGLRIVL